MEFPFPSDLANSFRHATSSLSALPDFWCLDLSVACDACARAGCLPMMVQSLRGQVHARLPACLRGSGLRAMVKRKADSTVASFAGYFHGFSWHSADPVVLAEGRLPP